ncbi:phosphotransferase [Mariniblastus sp.]|nr:phosphotransferase [Mariniblastus sp.]
MKRNISMDVSFEGIEAERLEAIKSSAVRLFNSMRIASGTKEAGVVWTMAESLWPALSLPEFAKDSLQGAALRIIPLGRIGQMEGKSGSLVVIGFFHDPSRPDMPHSHPVVIKTLSTEKRDKLREEFENSKSVKPFVYDHKDDFAIPIFFDDEQPQFHVLWSIFSPSNPIWPVGVAGSVSDSLKVDDLRNPLINGEDELARPIIESTFRLLKNLHLRLNRFKIEERKFGTEYARYLRKLDEGDWGSEWREIWADENTRRIEDSGAEFANPFWILKQLQPIKKHLFIGAVHGDLHPGNIVLADGEPRVIDFGWAMDGAHVAKDFVLMECNLRFHTVRPQLNQRDVYALSDWLSWDSPIPKGLGAYALKRAELIQHLRGIAKQTLGNNRSEVQWDWEYIVPLFFVSFGLLRVAPHLGNQQSAVRFVLALASHIERMIEMENIE